MGTSDDGRRLRLQLTAVLLLSSLTSCAGVGYSIAAMFRSEPDYEKLDASRVAPAGTVAFQLREPSAEAWPRYRGPTGDSVAVGSLPIDWSEQAPAELWRAPVGPAYSSFAVDRGLAITMEQRRDREHVTAFDAATGRVVWTHGWRAKFSEAMSKEGPRSTPTIVGEMVLALGATGVLRCLDLATGERLWRRAVLPADGANLMFGLAASPLVDDDVVFVQGAQRVMALELATGVPRWTALSEQLAYTAPQLATLLGVETLIVNTAERVVGLRPADGAELWSFDWSIFQGLSCTQPIAVPPDRLLVSAGYGKGARLVRVGDEPEVVWRSARFKTRFNEPVRMDGYAYGLDEGTLTCIEIETGRRMWKRGSYGYGQLIRVGDRLILQDEDGQLHLLRATPEGRDELGLFEALTGEMTLNVPALADGLLYVRDEQEAVCYDLRR